jgi:transposase
MIVDFKRKTKTGICPNCNKKRRKAIDKRVRIIRELHLVGQKCYIRICSYRIKCKCGYLGMEKLTFAQIEKRYSDKFAEYVYSLCEDMSLKKAAKAAMINWRTAKKLDKLILKEKFKDLSNINPTRIGIDEIAHEKGHKYLTIVRDLDAGVIWVGEKRKKETLDQFFKELGEEKSKEVTLAVMDMWDPYIASVKEHTSADIVFDKFHIVTKINEAVDKIRKKEYSDADPEVKKKMKKKRFLFLHRKKNLDEDKIKDLEELMSMNNRMYQAYLLKEQAFEIFDETREIVALQMLGKWKKNVQKANFEEFQKVLKTLERYWYGIKNYFKYQVTNGASEGFNNKINIIKRRAYGFKDFEYLKLKILQNCS